MLTKFLLWHGYWTHPRLLLPPSLLPVALPARVPVQTFDRHMETDPLVLPEMAGRTTTRSNVARAGAVRAAGRGASQGELSCIIQVFG